jgi:NADP-dependent 3-hydroxy acid dehydrogenase YdfG
MQVLLTSRLKEKKVAIVTGAARALGLLTAHKPAVKGYQFVLTARDMKEEGR